MTFNRFAVLGTLHALRTLVFARAPLGCDVSRAGNGMSAMRCLVLPRRRGPAVRVEVRAPSGSAVFRDGQHVSGVERVFTRHNPLVFQVRETVEGHNHAKSLIVVALVMRTSNDRRTSPAGVSRPASSRSASSPSPRAAAAAGAPGP